MKNILIFLIILLNFSYLEASSLSRTEKNKKHSEIIRSYFQQAKFLGNVTIIRNEDRVFSSSLGFADQVGRIPNSNRTIFRIQSLTKQVTAAAILLLAKNHKLSLKDSIWKYLPALPKKRYDIKIFHLLTHTSGLANYTDLPDGFKDSHKPISLVDLIKKFSNLPLEFKPGTKVKYNNSAYVLLGAIIESIAGKSFGDFVQENIFHRLEMVSSGYDHFWDIASPRAVGYNSLDGKAVPVTFMDMSHAHSAGAIFSTVNDMSKFVLALSSGALLGEKLTRFMQTPVKKFSGYGWAHSTLNNQKKLFHLGGGVRHGFHHIVSYFPEQNVIILILTNLGNSPVQELSEKLEKIELL